MSDFLSAPYLGASAKFDTALPSVIFFYNNYVLMRNPEVVSAAVAQEPGAAWLSGQHQEHPEWYPRKGFC